MTPSPQPDPPTPPNPDDTHATSVASDASAEAPASYADLAAWIGRSETLHDTVTPAPVVALTATLDRPAVLRLAS